MNDAPRNTLLGILFNRLEHIFVVTTRLSVIALGATKVALAVDEKHASVPFHLAQLLLNIRICRTQLAVIADHSPAAIKHAMPRFFGAVLLREEKFVGNVFAANDAKVVDGNFISAFQKPGDALQLIIDDCLDTFVLILDPLPKSYPSEFVLCVRKILPVMSIIVAIPTKGEMRI